MRWCLQFCLSLVDESFEISADVCLQLLQERSIYLYNQQKWTKNQYIHNKKIIKINKNVYEQLFLILNSGVFYSSSSFPFIYYFPKTSTQKEFLFV